LPNKDRWDKLSTISPIAALFVGAAITSWIIPTFTRQWAAQDYQKELELKSDLADQISKAVANMVEATHISINPVYINGTTSFLKAITDWQTSKSIIYSKIQTYYNDSQITKSWDNLSTAVSLLPTIARPNAGSVSYHENPLANISYVLRDMQYCERLGAILQMHSALFSENNPVNIDRKNLLLFHCNNFYVPGLNERELKTYFPVNAGSIDWNALFFGENLSGFSPEGITNAGRYYLSYQTLEDDIEANQDKLIHFIFKKQITAFQ
jgi:hypothetical protein